MGEAEAEATTSSAIQVFLRIRPSPNPSTYFATDDVNPNALVFNLPKARAPGGGVPPEETDEYVNNTRTRYPFTFDGIIDPSSTQEELFEDIGASAVQSALNGYNSTIFAYGQTGSGKTFTMTGGMKRYADRGIIPRSVSLLFDEFQKRREQGPGATADAVLYNCYVSYLELYNEAGYDLLERDLYHSSNKRSSSEPKRVTMMEDEDGNYHFRNLSVHPASSEEEVLNLLFVGDTNRAIGETAMNQNSSRSHCIFTIMLEARRAETDTVVRSKLNLVDLAGSERVGKTNTVGQTLREAKHINSSLFFLEMVIVALHERSKGKERTHIPYRNSMMTSVLRDSLGGNCKTMMIATISPEVRQTEESISTCQFAQRVALVENTAEINEEMEPELVISRLRNEVRRLREEIKFLNSENGAEEENGTEDSSISQEQKNDLEERIEQYVSKSDDRSTLDMGKITLNRIHGAYTIFKKIIVMARANNQRHDDDLALSPNVTGDSELEASPAALREQVSKLQRTLQRRDHEIAILVAMVKGEKCCDNSEIETISASLSSRSRDANGSKNYEPDKTTETEPKTSTKVCGVEHCGDETVLSDPSVAFDWFRSRYPGRSAIEENKAILRAKYKEAKDTADGAQTIRSSINHHKTSIEQMRKDRAVEALRSGTELDKEQILSPHQEEHDHREGIEIDKRKYKSSFNRLRALKGDIEHLERLLEKGTGRLQAGFEKWFRAMERKNQKSAINNHEEPNQEMRATQGLKSSLPELSSQSESVTWPETTTTTNVSFASPADESQTTMSVSSPTDASTSEDTEEDDFVLPDGVKLTGIKDVDDDIVAFYRFKHTRGRRNA